MRARVRSPWHRAPIQSRGSRAWPRLAHVVPSRSKHQEPCESPAKARTHKETRLPCSCVLRQSRHEKSQTNVENTNYLQLGSFNAVSACPVASNRASDVEEEKHKEERSADYQDAQKVHVTWRDEGNAPSAH